MYNHYFVGFAWAKTKAVAAAVHRNAGRIDAEISMDELPIRRPVRLGEYDYSQNGCYLVTVCTKDHQAFFRNANNFDELSAHGECVRMAIQSIPAHYQNVTVDEYVIMPNHIHLILTILNGENKGKSISTIIGQMKRWVSKQVGFPIWQKSYYEHIIRNEADYLETRQYILNNPLKWKMKHGLVK